MPAKRTNRNNLRSGGRTTPRGTRPTGQVGPGRGDDRRPPTMRSTLRNQGHPRLDTSAKGLAKSPRWGHQGGGR